MDKQRVTGIGGIFFKSKDPKTLRSWYGKHLGIICGEYGAEFHWRDKDHSEQVGYTLWAPFPDNTKYFDPGGSPFMINYRVADLKQLLEQLKSEGVTIVGGPEDSEYGKFAWIIDPDGRKIELWEPTDTKKG